MPEQVGSPGGIADPEAYDLLELGENAVSKSETGRLINGGVACKHVKTPDQLPASLHSTVLSVDFSVVNEPDGAPVRSFGSHCDILPEFAGEAGGNRIDFCSEKKSSAAAFSMGICQAGDAEAEPITDACAHREAG